MTDQHQTEAQRLAALLRSRNNNQAGFGLGPVCDEAAVELLRLNSVHADLERVSMQLVACGVVAMADTPDSAKKARAMHPDYESVSCDDVKLRVDECIELRARVAELEEILATLPISSLTRLRTRIKQLEEMLAAVGAGGVGPLVSTAVQHQHDFGGKNDLQRKADDSVTSCSTTAADWKLVPVVPTEEMLDAGRNACEGRFYPQDMLHGPRAMMADRWVAMLDAAPQPPTTEQSSAVERPQGERHLGVLMPSRSLVDQVIREIARYCNTGEMDDAESLLASLQLSLDPSQQPPTTEKSSAVEQPQGGQDGLRASNEYLLSCLRDWSELAVRLRTRVAELESQAAAPPVLKQPQSEQQPASVAKVIGMDEFGPMLLWHQAWTDFPVGTKLYTHQQNLRCKSNQARLATLWGYVKADQPQVEQEPVASLADAIRAEPTELIRKWRVLELIKDHTRPQPKPLTDEAVLGVAKSIEIQFDSERLNEQIDDILAFARAIERAHGIGGEA